MCFSANCKAGNVALTQLYTSAFVYKFVYGMVASLLSAHLHSLIRLPLAPHFSARSYASLFTSPLVHLPYPSQHRSPIFHSPLFSTRRFVYHTIQFVISRLGTVSSSRMPVVYLIRAHCVPWCALTWSALLLLLLLLFLLLPVISQLVRFASRSLHSTALLRSIPPPLPCGPATPLYI